MAWKEEFWASIKSFDTEEKLDLYFYRPFGFLIAKVAKVLRMSPTMLTFIGLILGVASGFYFYHNESNLSLTIASVLLVMAGVFDSSDGQLARMGGKSTKLGLVLDGLCDNFVFASAYIGSTLTLYSLYAPLVIWPIAFLAGFCHSLESSMLDFYNREYLYFGYGKVNGDYWNHTLQEARKEKRASAGLEESFFWALRFSWLWQQNKCTSRSDEQRYLLQKLVNGDKKISEEVQQLYREHNRFILRCWRLLGPNFHTILIILCAFARRFDWYLIEADIVFLMIALFVLRFFQKKQDDKLFAQLRARNFG